MRPSLEAFLSDLKRHTPTPASFVVAYSGGVDSTVLLHALHSMGLSLHAVHVNHQIQQQADSWEAHCKSQCEQWGVPFTALRVDVEPGDLGLEGQARVVRYRAIFNWMKTNQHTVLLCAHLRDDQLETVLLQLLRGSGLRGVGAMRVVGPVGVDRHLHPQLLLCRPLLNCSKASLLEYARLNHLQHIEDPSNDDTTLRRNWVRHELLPSLEEHFPQSPKALLQLAEFFQAHYSEEDSNTEAYAPQVVSASGTLLLNPWRELDETNQLNTLRHWLLGQGVRCGKLKLQELARQLRINKGGIRVVKKGWHVKVSRQQAHLQHTQP
ncbi:tRNA lysidine(34) synthetase TilS [Limnobacter sp.]|uniref:tRNA lysidine(34) synthetase TilS n=1 Tax=Limnobacter sp. TaxID=2003368 RepID=UPI003748F6AA